MTAGTQTPPCPKCGGNMWDNVQENRERMARGEKPRPDYKCRDKNCDGVIWPPKNGQKAAPARSNEKKPYNAGPYVPAIDGDVNPYAQGEPTQAEPSKGTQVARQYASTLDWVLTHVTPKLTAADIPVDAAAVNAMVATILIQASKV